MAVNSTSFKEAITKCKEIADAFQPGLKALGAESGYIKANNPKLIDGSVNIDKCLKSQYPQPATVTRRVIMQKARRHHTKWLRPLVGT